jgi:serine protease Do
MRRFVAFAPAFIVLLTAFVVLFTAPTLVRRVGYANTAYTIQLAGQTLDDEDILDKINKAVRAVAVAVEPSVVHIDAQRRVGGFREGSTGSGWVYDLDGHVVTNAHVVRDAESFDVHFFDGRVVVADLVGVDIYTDIAVLKVKTDEGLFPVRRAAPDGFQQGDRVFAFGSPFGFKFSMTQGIISGLGRNPNTAVELGGYANFIQTDAAVNPGNSGGPLIDIHGAVVGMNVAIATGRDTEGAVEGQSSGISFAIPIATIESVVPQLIRDGSVSRGYLGIQYRGMTPVPSGSPYAVGVYVARVVEGEPGQRAGLLESDIITEINGQRITSQDILRSVIATTAPGEPVAMRVYREGQIHDLRVELAEFPPSELARQSLEQYGVSLNADDGRVTTRITYWQSPAVRHGFRDGMHVLRIGDRPVHSPDEAIQRLVELGFIDGRTIRVDLLPRPDAATDEELSIDLQFAR